MPKTVLEMENKDRQMFIFLKNNAANLLQSRDNKVANKRIVDN